MKKKILNRLIKKSNFTKAEIERGVGLLNSLKILVNVLYAFLIFQVFLILPRPDDPELEYITLPQMFSEHIDQLIVIIVGIIMILTYWMQFNTQLGNLVRSSPKHAALAVIQMICLMMYLYFLRFDLEVEGLTLALQMESVFLALAGFIGIYNWKYAIKNELTSEQIDEKEERAIFYKILPEPIAALFSLPFASISPTAWTISFLVIIPLGYFLNILKKTQDNKSDIKNHDSEA